MSELGLSGRPHDKILRVARTIADLNAGESIRPMHLREAIISGLAQRAGQRQQHFFFDAAFLGAVFLAAFFLTAFFLAHTTLLLLLREPFLPSTLGSLAAGQGRQPAAARPGLS